MKRKILVAGMAITLSSSLLTFDYQINNGQNLLGAVEDINDLTIFDNKCVDYIKSKTSNN